MILRSAAAEHLAVVWMLLAAESVDAFPHAGINFPWCVFFQEGSSLRPPDPRWNMFLAMLLSATACIG